MRRFFGGGHHEWLDMEPRWLSAYADMMHRLEAEEALLATQIAFLPHYNKQSERRKVIRQWEQEARPKANTQYRNGREVLDNFDDLTDWLKSWNVM